MTVRARAALARALSTDTVSAIWVKSTCSGQLQIQLDGPDGPIPLFIPPYTPAHGKGINLLLYGTAATLKRSKSFLEAVRAGHLKVELEKKGKSK